MIFLAPLVVENGNPFFLVKKVERKVKRKKGFKSLLSIGYLHLTMFGVGIQAQVETNPRSTPRGCEETDVRMLPQCKSRQRTLLEPASPICARETAIDCFLQLLWTQGQSTLPSRRVLN